MLILLADDHAVVRSGLRQILREAYPTAQFAEARTSAEVLEFVPKQRWNLLILDLGLPDRSGLDALADVKSLAPDLPVLIVSMKLEEQYAVRCLKAGASGFLHKGSATEELVKATKRVLCGGRYISPELAEKLAAEIGSPAAQVRHELLSNREMEVLRLIVGGMPQKAIAERLNVSVKTVSTYRTRILEKMEMTSTAEVIRYSVESGLFEG